MQCGGGGTREGKERVQEVYHEITISDEVRRYLSAQSCDYRICTSCGGPILLPITIKQPKSKDIRIPVGERTLFISRYQASFLDLIDREMIPRYMRRHDY
jgi:hypothetical protein